MGFVATSLFTAALTVGGGYAAQALEARHADRKADYDRFVDLTEKMDKAAAGFMGVYLLTAPVDAEGRPRKPLPLDAPALVAKRHAVESNIQDQDGALQEIAIGLDDQGSSAVRAYRDQIGALYDALGRLAPAQDGHDLVQALSDSEQKRAELLPILKHRARRFL